MYYRKFYLRVWILLIPGFFLINSLKLLAFAYDGNYKHDIILKNCISEVVQTGIYTDYYVSTTGNDNNSGLSPESAWKTIAKVNATILTPGSKVYFKRGDEWRERLNVTQSGTASLPITYTAYGTGEKPILNGADVITGWHDSYNNIDTNIWGTVDPSEIPGCANVIIDNVLYKQVTTLAELTKPNTYWIKTASTPDSIFVYSTTNPDSRVTEVSHRNECIRGYNKNYINISYLEVKNASMGIYLGGSIHDGWCNIDSVYAYRNRLAGIEFVGPDFSHNIVSKCVATYNGNGILGWEGANNTTFSHCYTDHGVHNYIQASTKSAGADGSGLQFYISDNVVIEYCESDNDAGGIYFDPAGSAKTMTARYNYVHDSQAGTTGIGINQFTGGACWIYYNLLVNAGENEVGAFNSDQHQEGTVYVYNNTFYNDSIRHLHYQVNIAYGDNIIFKNNIFYFDCPAGDGDKQYYGILRTGDEGTFTSDYNQWCRINVAYNLKIVNTYYSDITAWTGVRNQDINSQKGDPLFTNGGSVWTLQPGSPCINKGVDVGLKQDLLGNPIVGVPDIGAFETQPTNIPVLVYLSSKVENATPSRLEMNYNLSLANIVPPISAFSVNVNSVARSINTVSISGTKVQLTLVSPIVYGDVVTISYAKPYSNFLQTASGSVAASVSNQPVINNCISISLINGTIPVNQPPVIAISNPTKGNKYAKSATITLDAIASDPDGSISKVEFYSGAVKLIELTSSPYTYTWKDISDGSYSITAVATDNLNASTTSLPIEFEVGTTIKYDANSEIINLYPNPNDGHFRIDLIIPLLNEKSQIIITDLAGRHIYHEPILKEETSKQFDLSYIKSGIYIMMIICKEILTAKKFIKN